MTTTTPQPSLRSLDATIARKSGWRGVYGDSKRLLRGTDPATGKLAFVPSFSDTTETLSVAIKCMPVEIQTEWEKRLIDRCGSIYGAINAKARVRAEVLVEILEEET